MAEPTSTRSLEERLALPTDWSPELGDTLIGTIVDIYKRDGKFGPYPVIVVLIDSGELFAFHASRMVAKDELARQRPQIGERIGIGYHGKPAGKSYESYRIIVERDGPPAPVDWDQIGTEVRSQAGSGVAAAAQRR